MPNSLSREVVDEFHRIYYGSAERTWLDTRWQGVRIFKYPTDLWIYQEILWEVRPELIVETGTAHGGSALFFASMCDLMGQGEVLSIDVEEQGVVPFIPGITYCKGSSVAPEVVERAARAARRRSSVMVVLDSDHHETHVLAELALYSPLVTAGSYLVVEDTNVNGNPIPTTLAPVPTRRSLGSCPPRGTSRSTRLGKSSS